MRLLPALRGVFPQHENPKTHHACRCFLQIVEMWNIDFLFNLSCSNALHTLRVVYWDAKHCPWPRSFIDNAFDAIESLAWVFASKHALSSGAPRTLVTEVAYTTTPSRCLQCKPTDISPWSRKPILQQRDSYPMVSKEWELHAFHIHYQSIKWHRCLP